MDNNYAYLDLKVWLCIRTTVILFALRVQRFSKASVIIVGGAVSTNDVRKVRERVELGIVRVEVKRF